MELIRNVLYVGIGSFTGGVLRYGISLLPLSNPSSHFPWATLGVNLVGSAVIGVVFALSDLQQLNPTTKLLLATGLLGGFTTFSSFSFDVVRLIDKNQLLMAFSYVMLSVMGGVCLCYLSYKYFNNTF